jgi:hypothetical protein
MKDMMRVGRKSSGLLVVVDERRERLERAVAKEEDDKFGVIEIRDEDTRERLCEIMTEILHMPGFRAHGIVLGHPSSTPQYEARRRLWRHFSEELLGTKWECEELC